MAPQQGMGEKAITKDDKIRLKKLQKKKELIALYKSKKISEDQFVKGLAKLGYSTDVEKVLAFKKFIQEQINAFERMDVDDQNAGGYHFDPNESKAKLPRDEYGNVITDFSVKPRPAGIPGQYVDVQQPAMVSARPPSASAAPGSPLFGDPLFQSSGPSKRKSSREEIPKATLRRDIPTGPTRVSSKRRRGMELEWDEDEEEDSEEMEEEDFEIDLEEGENGWWDDDEWELEWSDEDEEEWEDWDIDLDEEEEDEWEVWEDRLEEGGGKKNLMIEFEEEEEEGDGEVFDPRKYYWGDAKESDEEEEEEEEEDDDEEWGDSRQRRRRRGY